MTKFNLLSINTNIDAIYKHLAILFQNFSLLEPYFICFRDQGFQMFGQMSLEKDLGDVIAVFPFWIPHYTKLSLVS